jgi:RNA polymerase subunit RPABC4/transcription elongation factor Spt4
MSDELCPTCGSELDGELGCPLCLSATTLAEPEEGLAACRECGALVRRGAPVCDICAADHPTSHGGLAPVAQLALGFTVLAALLLIVNLFIAAVGF